MPTLKSKSIFLDAEWYMDQRVFLIGYAYNSRKCHQLYGKKLTKLNFINALKKVKGYVFAYGPDIGVCEGFFKWKFRNKYHCVNLMKVFRDHIRPQASFKLADLEVRFKLRRKVDKYKISIFHIWRDWRNAAKRVAVLTYNREDVINLVKIAKIIFKKFGVKAHYLKSIRLT